ncbi:MAG: hypothetical protein JXX28_07300 [Deltaproteobacteria bacterium]|nr:hypothetical protein [Deltaproteobacteria bacterium]
MHERIQIDALRTSDALTVETLAAAALRLPLGQLASRTIVDLFALVDVDGLSSMLRRDLVAFAARIEREVADLPDGATWEEFLSEYDAMPAERIPGRFREMLQRESVSEYRNPAARAAAVTRLEGWAEVEPELVKLPVRTNAVQRAQADAAEKLEKRRVSERTPRKRAVREKAPVLLTVQEAEQRDWVRKAALERLRSYGDNGLSEAVLMAGVMHAAKDTYPALAPQDVHSVLLELKKTGMVRQSAGRWKSASRW